MWAVFVSFKRLGKTSLQAERRLEHHQLGQKRQESEVKVQERGFHKYQDRKRFLPFVHHLLWPKIHVSHVFFIFIFVVKSIAFLKLCQNIGTFNGEKMNPFTGFLETLWAKNPKSWAWWSTGDRCGVNHQNPNHLLKLLNSLLPSKGVQMAAERLSRFGRMWKAQVNLVQRIFWGKRYYKNCGNL